MDCSLRFHRLRFLTISLLLWSFFVFAVLPKLILPFFGCCHKSAMNESFSNLKPVKVGQFSAFFF